MPTSRFYDLIKDGIYCWLIYYLPKFVSVIQHQLYNSPQQTSFEGFSSLWMLMQIFVKFALEEAVIESKKLLSKRHIDENDMQMQHAVCRALYNRFRLICSCVYSHYFVHVVFFVRHKAWQAERHNCTTEWLACGKTKLEWFILAVQILVQLSRYCFGSNQKEQSPL